MGFKNVMKNIGKVALKAAPIAASFIPGVGPLASMAIGAGTSALSNKLEGGNAKSSLLAGAMGGASGYLGGKTKGLSPSSKILSAGLAVPGIVAGMGGGGQQQQARGQVRGPANAGMGRSRRPGMMGGGLGPSFGNDPSGIINRRNPTMNPDMEFVQGGRTGGWIDGIGETIGQGRSITPAQYQAQIAQAQQAGIPQSWIQGYLQANPGDSNRLLEAYASEEGGRFKPQMQQAMQNPWQQFAGQQTGMPDYNPMNPSGQMNPMMNRRMMMGRSATQGRMGLSPSMAA